VLITQANNKAGGHDDPIVFNAHTTLTSI